MARGRKRVVAEGYIQSRPPEDFLWHGSFSRLLFPFRGQSWLP